MLDLIEDIGRRDWTRTNDPHHVKVLFAVKSKCLDDYKEVNWFVNSIVKLNNVLQRTLQCEGSACDSTAAMVSQWYCNFNKNTLLYVQVFLLSSSGWGAKKLNEIFALKRFQSNSKDWKYLSLKLDTFSASKNPQTCKSDAGFFI